MPPPFLSPSSSPKAWTHPNTAARTAASPSANKLKGISLVINPKLGQFTLHPGIPSTRRLGALYDSTGTGGSTPSRGKYPRRRRPRPNWAAPSRCRPEAGSQTTGRGADPRAAHAGCAAQPTTPRGRPRRHGLRTRSAVGTSAAACLRGHARELGGQQLSKCKQRQYACGRGRRAGGRRDVPGWLPRI